MTIMRRRRRHTTARALGAVLLLAGTVALIPTSAAGGTATGTKSRSLAPATSRAVAQPAVLWQTGSLHAAAPAVPSRRGTMGAAAGARWRPQATLTTHGAPQGQFGSAVALSRDTAVIGAPNSVVGASNTGAAYVYARSGRTWHQQARLTAADAAPADGVGSSIALNGDTAVVGAPGKNNRQGAAYVFVRSGSTWRRQGTLSAADGASSDFFGASVPLSGNTAVIGAYGKNNSKGAAYVFVRKSGTWSRQATLTVSNGAANDLLGSSVALSGSTALIGAQGKNRSTGAAYVYVRSGRAWRQQAMLTAGDGARGDVFGSSVALDGANAVVGAPYKNSSTGEAYVFVRT